MFPSEKTSVNPLGANIQFRFQNFRKLSVLGLFTYVSCHNIALKMVNHFDVFKEFSISFDA